MNWNKAQLKAIEERNKNILVAAAAGSGKTAVLVERILRLILEEKVEVDRILVVTFTKAAASEMKSKIIAAIKERIKNTENSEERCFLKKQLENTGSANISTFHSFAIDIIKRYYYITGINPNLKVIDETQAVILKEKAIDTVFDNEFEREENSEFIRMLKYPAIMRKNGEFELFKDKHGLVLAGMKDVRYREYELELNPGDRFFIYTDGVPEATDASNTLYGTDRMIEALNRSKNGSCAQILEELYRDIDNFTKPADQFDDITMLCLEIKESAPDMKKISFFPTMDKLQEVTAFFEDILSKGNAPMKVIAQINVVVDEIFSNIVQYSGATIVTLGCSLTENQVVLRFSDNGRPYNPIDKPDPDTSLSAEEREIGGLGIFMVKKIMDEVSYEYKDGLNIFTVTKKLTEIHF